MSTNYPFLPPPLLFLSTTLFARPAPARKQDIRTCQPYCSNLVRARLRSSPQFFSFFFLFPDRLVSICFPGEKPFFSYE